ncbi:hypothetical protein VDG03_20470 [Xanthomonas campestris pv. raphani]|uniref:hypothetical protein n=1 Tax=Xanthomonas campestris TaxID=339 RepID=UPI002B23739B|nr:hypothetical protein [Xanthomonas campestris]MEA9753338.1 hypothetical protein [Xanthomonas campestris pv. raphani]MEA9813608.1 hypothetical protein [Xanthomonas campestris pv. raphani]
MDRWLLHGPSRFVASVLDAVRDGSNVVIGASVHAAADLPALLEARIAENHNAVVISSPQHFDPIDAIYEALDLSGGGVMSRSVASLLSAFQRPEMIIVDFVDEARWGPWKTFLADYESASRSVLAMDRTQFIVCVRGVPKAQLSQRAPALEVFTWAGHISEFDVLSYVIERLRAQQGRVDQKSKLMARIIHRLAAWDLDLVDQLIALPWDRLFDPLRALDLIANGDTRIPLGKSWEAGGCCEVDGVLTMHALQLRASGDPGQELRMRLWAAQASELLPVLEIKRRKLAERIKCLNKVPLDARVNDEVVQDVLEVEIGGLAYLTRRYALPPDICRLAETLRDYRNKLAHLTPLTADEALDLLQ